VASYVQGVGRGANTLESILERGGLRIRREPLGEIGSRYRDCDADEQMFLIRLVEPRALYDRLPESVQLRLLAKAKAEMVTYPHVKKLEAEYGEIDLELAPGSPAESSYRIGYRMFAVANPDETIASGQRPFPYGELIRTIAEMTSDERAAVIERIS